LTPVPTIQLLTAARDGDRAALEELFTLLLPRVRQVAALRMGCRETDLWDREDLVQETLLDAFRSLPTFEVRGEGSLVHWLAQLVQNNLTDHARHRHAQRRDEGRRLRRGDRSTLLTDTVLGAGGATPSQFAQADESEQRVEAALLAMDARQRRVIELRRLCEFSFEEIAKELDLGAESSARSLYSRAMAELAQRLEVPER
jgi:RNA polymerase sigma factor (sigma-70 family)